MASINNTIIGYENYLNSYNKSIFSQMVLPSGLDKTTLTNYILLRGGEFESLYGDPDFLTFSVGVWSRKMLDTFSKWVYAMSQEYNPIENYDRYEDWSIANTGTVKNSGETNNDGTITNVGDSSDTGTIKDESRTTNKVSAFNDNELVNNSSDDSESTRTLDTNNHVDNTTTNNNKIVSADVRTDNLNEKRVAHIHGNIGVKTAAEMLAENNELLEKWNLYDKITDLFLAEFSILVY